VTDHPKPTASNNRKTHLSSMKTKSFFTVAALAALSISLAGCDREAASRNVVSAAAAVAVVQSDSGEQAAKEQKAKFAQAEIWASEGKYDAAERAYVDAAAISPASDLAHKAKVAAGNMVKARQNAALRQAQSALGESSE
jgi:hypothetical protein